LIESCVLCLLVEYVLKTKNFFYFWFLCFWFFSQQRLILAILLASIHCSFELCLKCNQLLVVLLRIERSKILETIDALLRVRHGIVYLVPTLVDRHHLVADLGDLHKSGICIILGQALEKVYKGLGSMAV